MTGASALVLGATGRNVAAGMSGGIAYFLDLDLSRLNTEMVDALEPSAADLETVRRLVVRHHEETESVVAAGLLADWATRPAFHQGAAAGLRPGARRPGARPSLGGLDDEAADRPHDASGEGLTPWLTPRAS